MFAGGVVKASKKIRVEAHHSEKSPPKMFPKLQNRDRIRLQIRHLALYLPVIFQLFSKKKHVSCHIRSGVREISIAHRCSELVSGCLKLVRSGKTGWANSNRGGINTRLSHSLSNLPTYPLDRLSRYEASLWRQACQILFTLRCLERRKPWGRFGR
jgi:hypothetical protein